MQYAPTLPANGRRAHISENISGANERHRPLSDIRVGAYCIRPRCSGPRTIAPDRHPPQSKNISGANERQAPLSDIRVGAQKHTPPMFPAGNNSARQASAAIGFHFIGGWVSSAHKMVSDGGEWASGTHIGNHFGGEWIAMARKKVSNGSESVFWAPIRFQFISK